MDPLSFKLGALDALDNVSDYVTQQNIADNAVGTLQVANGAITADKLGFTPTTTGKAIAMAIVFGG